MMTPYEQGFAHVMKTAGIFDTGPDPEEARSAAHMGSLLGAFVPGGYNVIGAPLAAGLGAASVGGVPAGLGAAGGEIAGGLGGGALGGLAGVGMAALMRRAGMRPTLAGQAVQAGGEHALRQKGLMARLSAPVSWAAAKGGLPGVLGGAAGAGLGGFYGAGEGAAQATERWG